MAWDEWPSLLMEMYCSAMVKMQIQFPDALYRDPKRLAAARSAGWQPPGSDAVGWRGLSHEEVHAAALDETEPRERGW